MELVEGEMGSAGSARFYQALRRVALRVSPLIGFKQLDKKKRDCNNQGSFK